MKSKAHVSEIHGDMRSFLTARRARLRPEEVGLQRTRRRVPGLRREDVAELVGVSERWYASFELGKSDRHFSAVFIHRVADALRLDHADRVWLFRLALPEAAAVAEHFEVALSRAEGAVIEAQAATGRALASTIYGRLSLEETLREVQAAAGRAIASAICTQLVAYESSQRSQAAAGRALASAICERLAQKELTNKPAGGASQC